MAVSPSTGGAKLDALVQLVSSVLEFTGRASKLDRLNHPEVKVLNLGVVLSGLLLMVASAADSALEATGIAAAAGAAAGSTGSLSNLALTSLAACPKVTHTHYPPLSFLFSLSHTLSLTHTHTHSLFSLSSFPLIRSPGPSFRPRRVCPPIFSLPPPHRRDWGGAIL
jgi:hypothetical protein